MQRGRNLSVRGPPTQPDPLEKAEEVLGTWQLLWTEAARRRARLQSALLVGQVERVARGGAGRGAATDTINQLPMFTRNINISKCALKEIFSPKTIMLNSKIKPKL